MLTTLGTALLLLTTRCAVYDENLRAAESSVNDADAGAAGPVRTDDGALISHIGKQMGSSPLGGIGGVVENGGTGGELTHGGSVAAAGGDLNVGAGNGVGGVGGTVTAGNGGSVSGGATGISGSGGSTAAGQGNTGGDANGGAASGGSANDNNLSRGKPAHADSEQTTKLHYATDANDGDRTTRWCAANYKPNHSWEVDLGQSYSLSSLRILWEKDAGYLFKVESSVDHASWSLILDKTESNSATANQQHSFVPGAMGRYVRVTVTGGLSTTIWASFYELDVFGH